MTGEKSTHSPRNAIVVGMVFLPLLGWAFFPTLNWLTGKWIDDPQYSHGFLVPLVSIYLLHLKWDQRQAWLGQPAPWLAGLLVSLTLGMRLLAGGLLFHQLDMLAFLMSIVALVLVVGGVTLLKTMATAIIFLIFMVPLPYEIEQNLGGPLKIIASRSSVYLLQTLGYPAVLEGGAGNVILIDEARMGVVDACNGLKMLLTFSCFGVGAMMLLDRTWFEKFLIFLGIVPIALVSNICRITATGILYTSTDKSKHQMIHDTLGYPMMLLGLLLLGLQLWVLSRLVVRPKLENTLAGVSMYGFQPQPRLA